ncbi:MAG: sodium ion-translocating decarboxylase subunit beta [Oscillospiraceae bacterium]|nr:sodium ion-translocating decarboxylase subunit beta [Oscillospiraceae bacterium]
MLQILQDILGGLWDTSGLNALLSQPEQLFMILISFGCMYLAIVWEFEPLLLLPISFGMFLSNLPAVNPEDMVFHAEYWNMEQSVDWLWMILHDGGLLDKLYLGVKLQIYPCLIFLGIGTMTDFGPLIANPKSFLLGAAAQGGIFFTFLAASYLGMTAAECGSIAIIGGADGPTSIYVSSKLLDGADSTMNTGTIALVAYMYMALVPVIQPPLMRLLTTKKEREIKMPQLRTPSKTEKMIFPIVVTLVVALLVPSAASLVGMLMFGNILKESGVCSRLVDTAQNALMNIVTIFLGISVGATTTYDNVWNWQFLKILLLGVVAFSLGTCCGLVLAKIMNWLSGGKINPLIGSAGVSAVPMAARISQKEGARVDPTNFLLMHAMGPNVAGVIGSAVAAGILLSVISN